VVVICVSADADVRAVIEGWRPGSHRRAGHRLLHRERRHRALGARIPGRAASRSSTRRSAAASKARRKARWPSCAAANRRRSKRARPILAAMGKTIEHFGQRRGQATKATNQIMCAGIIRACAEAMAFAGAHQLPLERVVSTLGAGAGSSWYFVHRAPNMVRGSYPAGFRVKLHAKDLGICRDMAARFGVHLPVVDSMLAEYAQLIEQGFGDEDISATHRLKQALFKGAARR
jgi:3-hydroxyisobutyrate dehydrogenase